MEKKYLGLNGQYISCEEIPFDNSTLCNYDIIEGSEKGEQLIYIKEDKVYRLVTNNSLTFLTTPFQQWKKI
jgi:hypothetical protein